jgi:hypothetical protein
MTYGTIGTVSAGTMRSEDLIPAFTEVLDELRDPDNQFHAALVKESNGLIKNDLEDAEMLWNPDVLDWFRAKLSDALNEYAPPYSYFGSHPDFGADYGFWVDDDYLNEYDMSRPSRDTALIDIREMRRYQVLLRLQLLATHTRVHIPRLCIQKHKTEHDIPHPTDQYDIDIREMRRSDLPNPHAIDDGGLYIDTTITWRHQCGCSEANVDDGIHRCEW